MQTPANQHSYTNFKCVFIVLKLLMACLSQIDRSLKYKTTNTHTHLDKKSRLSLRLSLFLYFYAYLCICFSLFLSLSPKLTPSFMEPGGLMPHSQGLSNNPYPEPNQPNLPSLIPISSRSILILSSHLRLGLPKGLFPVGLPVKILKALLLSSILATCSANLKLLDLINLTIIGERYKL